jgi:hypothetical protein
MSTAFVVVVFLAAVTAATRQWRRGHQIFADIDGNHMIPNAVSSDMFVSWIADENDNNT